MEEGTRIEWTYTHSLNSKSKVQRTKTGSFIRMVISKKHKPYKEKTGYAIVKFDNNKSPSKVWFADLKEIIEPHN